MKLSFSSLLKLDMLPVSADLGLLVLRAWLGLSMFLIHGLAKFENFSGTVTMYHDKMGFPTPLGAAAVLAESACSLLLVIGFATRWAAAMLATTMGVAFYLVHGTVLTFGNPKSGELAFIYLGGFVVLLLAGAGRFSADGNALK